MTADEKRRRIRQKKKQQSHRSSDGGVGMAEYLDGLGGVYQGPNALGRVDGLGGWNPFKTIGKVFKKGGKGLKGVAKGIGKPLKKLGKGALKGAGKGLKGTVGKLLGGGGGGKGGDVATVQAGLTATEAKKKFPIVPVAIGVAVLGIAGVAYAMSRKGRKGGRRVSRW